MSKVMELIATIMLSVLFLGLSLISVQQIAKSRGNEGKLNKRLLFSQSPYAGFKTSDRSMPEIKAQRLCLK